MTVTVLLLISLVGGELHTLPLQAYKGPTAGVVCQADKQNAINNLIASGAYRHNGERVFVACVMENNA